MKLVSTTVPFLVALTLGACGGDSGTPAAGAGEPDDEAELAFARCMREAGIDLPDPGTTRDRRRAQRIGEGVSPAKMRESMERCRKKTGGGPRPLTEEQQAEFRDAALKFARCMRRNGVDIPDPAPSPSGGGGGLIRIGPGPGRGRGIDRRSPAFERARKACEELLPRPPGGGARGAVRVR